jgi:hypothetical protein
LAPHGTAEAVPFHEPSVADAALSKRLTPPVSRRGRFQNL